MKKLFPFTLFAIGLASCSKNHFIVGMSEEKFLIQNHKVVQISSTARETVYKKTDYGPVHLPSTRFFYFEDSRLVRVEESKRQPGISFQNY